MKTLCKKQGEGWVAVLAWFTLKSVTSARPFRRTLLAATLALPALTGCHSAYVDASVTNATAGPITLVEVDYPSASFGQEAMAAGAVYHYRFKVLGQGPTKVIWTDAAEHEHATTGLKLSDSDEGTLAITIGAGSADIAFQRASKR